MDGFNEKKWFVYLSDHHEGPFSLAELQSKLAARNITSVSFVWCEGMGDWKPMNEVPECESILAPGASKPPSFGGPDLRLTSGDASQTEPTLMSASLNSTPALMTNDQPAELSSPGLLLTGVSANDDFSGLRPKEEAPSSVPAASASPQLSVVEGDGSTDTGIAAPAKKRRKFVFLALFLVAVGGAGFAFTQGLLDPVLESPALQGGAGAVREFAYPYLQQVADRFPSVARWVSPLPQLPDVSPEEFEELKAAAIFSNNPADLSVALALSTEDVTAPSFYVSSFLPEGAEFDVFIEGIPETLLNHLSFRHKAKARLTKRHGKSEPVRLGNGPLPRGRYKVTVMESETQAPEVAVLLGNSPGMGVVVPAGLPKGRKLIATKTYFLGGPEDEAYQTRLKDFHDKLRARATAELSEVNQFMATLENQLSSTLAKFAELRKAKKLTPAHKKNWEAFRKTWDDLSSQISSNFPKWTPEALQREYFYGVLFKLTRQAGESVIRVHDLHNQYITMKVLPKAFDIQLGEAEASAQGSIGALKAKIEQAQAMASETLPRREGL